MFQATGKYASDQVIPGRMLTASTASTTTTEKKSYRKTVIVVALIVLAVMGVKYAPTSAASPGITCSTSDWGPFARTSCSDGSYQDCTYSTGHCTFVPAAQANAQRQGQVGFYEDLLRGAGFCNVVACVK